MFFSRTPSMSPHEISIALASREISLVDVREAPEHASERIEGALLHPLSTFDPGALLRDARRPIVFHCLSGARSAKAYSMAAKAGLPLFRCALICRAASLPGNRPVCRQLREVNSRRSLNPQFQRLESFIVSFVRSAGPALIAAFLVASAGADAKGDAPPSNPGVELTARNRRPEVGPRNGPQQESHRSACADPGHRSYSFRH